MIFLNAILRPSILYACETYYSLSEYDLRQLERIEENYLRKIFKTPKSCPIVQLYLESGQIPARFEIQRLRLLYLQNILKQNPASMIYKFFQLQVKNPTRGDWVTACLKDLKELRIDKSFEQIKEMTKSKYNNLLKKMINENALDYLTKKKGAKGKEITYKNIEMAEYLQPYSKISVIEKRKLFEIRNKMTNIPNNYKSRNQKIKCWCGEDEEIEHIYSGKILNKNEKIEIKYEEMYRNNLKKQMQILRILEKNLERRKSMNNENEIFPCDLLQDPLNCKRFSNG